MAQENKNPNWIKWVFGTIVLVVLFFGAIYIINQKSPLSLSGVQDAAYKGANDGIKDGLQSGKVAIKAESVEVSGDLNVKGNQTVEKDSIVNGNQDIKGSQTVKKDQTVEGNVTVKGNETVEGDQTIKGSQTVEKDQTVNGDQTVKGDQTIEGDSTVNGDQTIKGDQFINGDQTIGGCQKKGSCGVSAPASTAPSCTSNCSSEGQARCVANCLTGDQREVCVRSGSCLIWQRQDCSSGQYCDNGTCRTVVAPTVERKCWNNDVWTYVNGSRQGLVEDCGETQYLSATEYRCSGNSREWKSLTERSCVDSTAGAYCKVKDNWILSEVCYNGCENSRCKQAEVIPAPTCAGSCGQPTVVVTNIININNQTGTPAPTQTGLGYMPAPNDAVSHGCTGCIVGPDPNPPTNSSGTGYLPTPSSNTGTLPTPSSSSCPTGNCVPGPDPN